MRIVVELVRERIRARLSVDPVDGIQALASMHKGASGSTAQSRSCRPAVMRPGADMR
ncbi:MAG: hypothetical protein NTU62_14790 [Spirochaetes bacterium]|nr:hypothetical protein [Spirochaetota bacterium]